MEKMMNIKLFILLALYFPTKICAQIDSSAIEQYIYNRMYKNIAAHNIKYGNVRYNGAVFKPIFHRNSDFFYESFLPDFGFKLDMQINKLSWSYPITDFEVYQVIVDEFRYEKDNGYGARKSFSAWTDKYFLIALNRSTKEIKFISGQFFISAIADDFKLNTKEPQSLLEYLKFRVFRYQVKDITFIKKKQSKYYYHAYSESLKKNVTLIVYLNDLEEPRVIAKKEKQQPNSMVGYH